MQFKEVKILKKSSDYQVAIIEAIPSGERWFAKMAFTDAGRLAILREYHNQKLLYDLSQKGDCGFLFLEPKWDGDCLLFSDISSETTWLGDTNLEVCYNIRVEPLSAYLEEYMKLQRVMRGIRFEDLPQEIKADWEVRNASMKNSFQTNCDYFRVNKLLNEEAIVDCVQTFEKFGDNWTYQHHDILPWHIARKKDGKLILVDSGWACWSLKYYDLAYYYLQMIAFADRPTDSEMMLARARAEYGHEADFKNILKSAFIYRGFKLVRELDEVMGNKEVSLKVLSYMTKVI